MAQKSTSSSSETGEAIAADTPETREEMASKLVDRFALWSGVAGLIPVPVIDVFAVGGLQIQMVRRHFANLRCRVFGKSRQGSNREFGRVDDSGDQRYRCSKCTESRAGYRNDRRWICNAGAFCWSYLRHRQSIHSALCYGRDPS